MKRWTFIKNAGIIGGMMVTTPLPASCKSTEDYDFPLIDLHVHLTNTFTINNVTEIAKERNVKFGILNHPADWALRNDDDLKLASTVN